MATWTAPEYHPAFEEYCETIFELAEDDLDVIQARIADRMGISRPAVSEMIRRMQDQGLLEPGRRITLTDDGMQLARQVVRRHRLAERFLTDVLGLSWAEAHAEAGAGKNGGRYHRQQPQQPPSAPLARRPEQQVQAPQPHDQPKQERQPVLQVFRTFGA